VFNDLFAPLHTGYESPPHMVLDMIDIVNKVDMVDMVVILDFYEQSDEAISFSYTPILTKGCPNVCDVLHNEST
jgi:hypothetical protein